MVPHTRGLVQQQQQEGKLAASALAGKATTSTCPAPEPTSTRLATPATPPACLQRWRGGQQGRAPRTMTGCFLTSASTSCPAP
jgi:hypothetical protein